MSVRVAFQADPLRQFRIAGDSTFALMLEAAARGYAIWHYEPRHLSWRNGGLRAWAVPVISVADDPYTPFMTGHGEWLDLADTDVIWVRQEPPYDLGYITACHLLETLPERVRVVNDPAGVRQVPEKLGTLTFGHLMPPTLISSDREEIAAFFKEHGALVLKPLHWYSGKGVTFLNQTEGLGGLLDTFHAAFPGQPVMAQAFLPGVRESEKRILLVNGEAVAAFQRIPQEGDIRANLAQGGSARPTELSAKEKEVVAAFGPYLRQHGIVFAGLDTIDGLLIEVNVTCPTGLRTAEMLYGLNAAGAVWDAVITL